MTEASVKRSPGWWYPLIYVGGFGVVLVVNLYFAFQAVHSFTGVEKDAYEKGLAYNQVLAQARAQERLGWTMEPAVAATGAGHEQDVVVRFKDRDGRPLDGLTVAAAFIRPTTTGFDLTVALRGDGDGRYVGRAPLKLPGQWEMEVDARRGAATYRMARRIVVP